MPIVCESCQRLQKEVEEQRLEIAELDSLLGGDRQKLHDVAVEYYKILDGSKGATPEEKKLIEMQLDALAAPFSDNIAYHAFLKMERLAAGLEL